MLNWSALQFCYINEHSTIVIALFSVLVTGMPSHTKSSGTNRRAPTGSRKKSPILNKSWKEFQTTRANMCPVVNKANHKVNVGSQSGKQYPLKNINIGQPSAKIVNNSSVAKGASKSNHVSTSKGMKQPTASSFEKRSILVEKRKALSRSTVDGKARLNETHALKRKREANDASQPTHLKAMPGLVPKTTDRLGHYSDSSSRLNKRESSDKDITSAKYSTTKLEFSKGVYMVPKDSCTTKGNDRQDEIVIDNDKENVKFGEYHKERDTTKSKHTLDSTLSDIHCNSRSISSYPFGRDLPKFQRDNHSMNLTFEIVEKRGLIERNMGQFGNCNGKNSNSVSKKKKEPLSAENPKALDDDSNVDTMGCKQMKKLKHSHVGVEEDTVSVLKNDHAKVSVSSCVEQQCYSCSKPIDQPTWRYNRCILKSLKYSCIVLYVLMSSLFMSTVAS
jgi:hypothetical protein